MSSVDIDDLVSQSEELGITLAELMAQSLSSSDLDNLQASLNKELATGYKEIEDFMSDISVPSIEEILSDEQFTPPLLEFEDDLPLSDDADQFVDYA